MSRRLLLLGLLLSHVSTGAAVAQVPGLRGPGLWGDQVSQPSPTAEALGRLSEGELERMIDSLAPLVEQAATEAETARRASMAAARARAETRSDLDTLSVLDMTIVAPRSEADAAREVFTAVRSQTFQGFESASLSRWTFTYQRATYDVEEIPVEGERAQVVVPTWHSRAQVEAGVRSAVGRVIAADLDGTKVGAWATGNPFTARDPGGLYREMILARSLAVRRCLDGDVESCSSALGLGLGEDVLEVWYTPEERRERVLSQARADLMLRDDGDPGLSTDAVGSALARCARLSAPTACYDFIDPAHDSWLPLPTRVRETLVALAVRRGGTGAWGRLIEDPAMAPEAALAYAAGMPLEDLVAAWRDWVLSNRPEVYAGLGGSSALTLLWILLFAALAGRSTRWRFD